MDGSLEERTIGGLHDHLMREVLPRWRPAPGTAVDLGAGSGALATRLTATGWEVIAIERDLERFSANVPVVSWDLDQRGGPGELAGQTFDLVVATEVIEHVESPIAFLRLVRSLLRPDGVAILTTPNVDNVLSRVKFLIRDEIRMMDRHGDPTHISPIFLDLLTRRLLPRAGLRIIERTPYPPSGFLVTRRWVASIGRVAARVVPGAANLGDNHVLVLAACDPGP
jgi:2-polyprenyl-3-methyl-5-hydroxy-6-metoxy-1,4-benzoquinol methylase